MDGPSRYAAARRPQRFWLWRHQLPRCAGRVHSRQAQRKRQAVGSCHYTLASCGREKFQCGDSNASVNCGCLLQSSVAWRAGDRRCIGHGNRRASADSPERCRGRSRTSACRSGGIRPESAGTAGDRLRRRRRSGRQVDQGAEGVESQPSSDLEGPASTRHLSWTRPCGQSGVLVHRARLAVRQHAGAAARRRTNRGRYFCRSGPHHDSATR